MDCRSSVGMPKTIHLALDWHHNESPLGGRSAVDCLLKSARAPFAVNIRREFEKCKRDKKRVNRVEALSGETENSGERVPQRAHRRFHADSPRQEGENRILWKYRQVLGISCGGAQDGWCQPTGRWRSEGQNLAHQVGFELPGVRLTLNATNGCFGWTDSN